MVSRVYRNIVIDNDKIVESDDNTDRVLNTFFSNIVSDLNYNYNNTDYNNYDLMVENIQEPVLKAIVKYRNHPSILTLGSMQTKPLNFLLGVLIKMKF